jgi:hypothetical protein
LNLDWRLIANARFHALEVWKRDLPWNHPSSAKFPKKSVPSWQRTPGSCARALAFQQGERGVLMIGLTEIRAIAMALPQVEEGPPVPAARRIAGFKVAGKSFVGVETGGGTMTVSLPEKEARAIVPEDPKAYEEIWRNRKMFMGLRVDLSAVAADRVRDLIERSWRHCATARRAAR